MKAAVIYRQGDLPHYTDMPDPVAQNEDELLLTVTAAALKHVDKGRAAGRHYSADTPPARSGHIPGGDGVGRLSDGRRVYGIGVTGMLAEKALIDRRRIVPVPDGLDDATAAALPNAVIGAAMGLRFKAGLQPGDVVLVNGATGFTGRVAVQLAKYYGAAKVIVTGRNSDSLEALRQLGADAVVPVTPDDDAFGTQLSALHAERPIDVVIDYLWGRTAEIILACLKGNGRFTNRVRYVSVGSVTGDAIQLSAANLRSVDLQLSGSGLGAWSREQVGLLFSEILPEAFGLTAQGRLQVETVQLPLAEIDRLWHMAVPAGQRLVVRI